MSKKPTKVTLKEVVPESGWVEFMKNNGSVVVICIVVTALIAGFASVLISKKHDNIIEETAENIVESQLNLPDGSVDLTPSTPE